METTRTTITKAAKWAGLSGILIASLTSCGLDNLVESAAESAAENAVERVIEADTGEDVELDFGTDGISIETDEGSLEFDAETGEFVIVDENGEETTGNIEIDESGLNIESDEGSVTFNAETGEFEVTDEDGNQVANGEVDEDGNVDATFDSDDGEATVRSGAELASEWPSDILSPYPKGTVIQAAEYAGDDGVTRLLTLSTNDSVDQVFDFYDKATKDWSGTRSNTDDGMFMIVENEEITAQISANQSGDSTEIALVLINASE